MDLLVVIVNYKTAGLTTDCLRSLAPEVADVPSTRVVVTDNCSGDDSAQQIGAAIAANGWGDWASVVPLPRNGGFAYGNNEGIRPALESPDPPRYVWMLNPDTLVKPGAIRAMLEFLDANRKAGIAGTRVINEDQSVRRSAFRFHNVASELEAGLRVGIVSKLLSDKVVAQPIPQEVCEVDWVSGASMFVRREVFMDIGLLDESYFMYFEETDFSLRARRKGWTCWYVPSASIVHLVGQASGVTGTKKNMKRRPKYWFDSRRHYFMANHGPATVLLADLAWATSFGLSSIWRRLMFKPRTDPPMLWWDFVRHSVMSWSHRR
ncbi:MAG TPA: glycosyltransferase family 2 protein [Tepidisphaeraceae bacterium]|nr:glycosyltransferase family 2 protein [Tepidisphaeraceae bacterium]